MTGPDFLGIGAQKAGTTWLYRNMRRHPGLWLPPVKELHYFDHYHRVEGMSLPRYLHHVVRGDDGFARRWRGLASTALERNLRTPRFATWRWDRDYFLRRPDDAWYRRLFDHGPVDTVRGEITPAYSSLSGERFDRLVAAVDASTRIVLMLRNPVERAWSHATMDLRRSGVDPAAAPQHVVMKHLDSRSNRARTDYRGMLERWGRAFDRDRILVGFMEDVADHPTDLLSRTYDFLGLGHEVPHEPLLDTVFSHALDAVPHVYAAHLASTWGDDVAWLADTIGGHARTWEATVRRIEAWPSGDPIPLPLHRTLDAAPPTLGPRTCRLSELVD